MPNIRKIDSPTVEYNGFSFSGSYGGETDVYPPQFKLSSDFIYDDAGRNTVYTKYTLTVTSVVFTENEVTPGTALGDDLKEILDLLATPHKRLNIHGMGLPFESVIESVAWGVQPKQVTYDPIAGLKAVYLTFVVEFCMATQAGTSLSGQKNRGVFYALNWATTWSIDESGLTTRTVSGYYQIAGKVESTGDASSGKIVPVAISDEFRDNLEIPVPVGFRRLSQNWQENLAKDRLMFNIVDKQWDFMAFPVFCTNAKGKFAVSVEMPGAASGSARLSMTLEIVPGVHRSVAVRHFLRAAFDRQQAMLGNLKQSKRTVAGTVIPKFAQSEVGIFDRVVTYTMDWVVVGCLMDVIYGKEMYDAIRFAQYDTPPQGGTSDQVHNTYKTSLGMTWDSRGHAGLTSPKPNDRVINAQDGKTSHEIVAGRRTMSPGFATTAPFTCPSLPPEQSWIAYDVSYEFRQETPLKFRSYMSSVIEHLVENNPVNYFGKVYPTTGYKRSDDDLKRYFEPAETGYYMIMYFKGLRAEHAPSIPMPKDAIKRKIHQVWRSDVGPTTVGNAGCHALRMTVSTAVFWSPNPFKEQGESARTGFCDNRPAVKSLADD